ncbi:MAG TPA: hypothetical protein VFC89_00015 [Oscillospiraceae bacterium]|nr:hypothetical protein [Oscillospiraceae bacterium]
MTNFKSRVRIGSASAAACMALAFATTANATTYKSYPMLYMTQPSSDEPTVNLAGLIEPTYRDSSEANLKNDFSFDRLRIGFNGSVSRNVDYFFMSEWAPNAVTSKSGGGAQAFIAHLTFKDLLGVTNLAVGSMAVPMGYDFYAPTPNSPWITYADHSYNLYGCGSIDCAAAVDMPNNIFTNIWKPGLMVFDQIDFSSGGSLTYTAGAYNTTGTTFTDNRVERKDFNGTLEYKHGDFMAMYGTRIGSSRDTDLWRESRDRTRHALSFMYKDYRTDRWWLWAEYMRAKDEQETGVADIKADGYFVAGGFKPTDKTLIAYRHSYFDPNKDSSNNTRRVNSIIGTYKMDNGIRLQAQFDKASEDSNFSGAIYPGDTFMLRVQLPLFVKLK